MKKKITIIVIIALIVGLFINVANNMNKTTSVKDDYKKIDYLRKQVNPELTDAQKAFKEVAYAYYMRGTNLQYNSMKSRGNFPPEDATSQNINYTVCSGLTRNIYKELLGILIPNDTDPLLRYSRTLIGKRPEVILSASKNSTSSGNNENENEDEINDAIDDDTNNEDTDEEITYTIKFADGNTDEEYDMNQKESILPYLRCGDVFTYTGHTMVIYDLIFDEDENVVDAWVMQSTYNGNAYVVTKQPRSEQKVEALGDIQNENGKKITTAGEINFGRGLYSLHYENRKNKYTQDYQGTVRYGKLSDSWAYFKNKDEYSVLRFTDRDDDGNAVLNYKGTGNKVDETGKEEHNNEIINLSEKDKGRLKYSKLYIEKTVDACTDDFVKEGDILTYQILVKNKSENSYTNDLKVTENISEFVTYQNNSENITKSNSQTDANNKVNKLEWNLGKLQSGEEKIITYKVKVNKNTCGQTIESTGKVGNIDSSNVTNKIRNELTSSQKKIIEDNYDNLSKSYKGKELIDKIYEKLGIDLKLNQTSLYEEDYEKTTKTVTQNGNQVEKNIITVNTKGDNTTKNSGLIRNYLPGVRSIKSTLYNGVGMDLNYKNPLYKSMLNNYYNVMAKRKKVGEEKIIYGFKYWENYEDERRPDTVYEENFKTGDILVYANYNGDVMYTDSTNMQCTYEDGEYAYIYIEGRGFVGVNYGADGKKGTNDDRNKFDVSYYQNNNENGANLKLFDGGRDYNEFEKKTEEELNFYNYQTLLGKDYYIILRPSANMNSYTLEESEGVTSEGSTISGNKIYGETVTLKAEPLRGYTFEKWLSSNEEEVPSQAKANTTFIMPSVDITMTPTATLNNYTITYNLDGGTANENPTSYNVNTESFTLKQPTKEGYTFKGWTGTDLEEETLNVSIEKGSIGDREYTAVWEKNNEEVIAPDPGTNPNEDPDPGRPDQNPNENEIENTIDFERDTDKNEIAPIDNNQKDRGQTYIEEKEADKKDTTTANKEIPQTGEKLIKISILVGAVISLIIFRKKYMKNKDIK